LIAADRASCGAERIPRLTNACCRTHRAWFVRQDGYIGWEFRPSRALRQPFIYGQMVIRSEARNLM
jgi:hypothetical protein